MVLKSINPSNEEILKEFGEDSQKEIEQKLKKSIKGFSNWKNISIEEKSKFLKTVGEILKNNKNKYARLMTLEMGKPITQAKTEVEKCAWICDFYAENGKNFLENNRIKTDADSSFIQYNPLGVILGIMPWNFPFWQVFRFSIPSLMAGNVVLLKHSSNVPQCALAIDDIFKKAGFKHYEFQTMMIRSNKISNVIEDKRVAAVSLTGSSEAGMKTAEIAGKNIKKTVLELGGSDPFIVFEDADLDYTVDMAVKARMINNGQSCIAAKRFIVFESIFDKFVKLLTDKINNLSIGDPLKENCDIGPLATKDIVDQLDRQVKKSIEMGGEVIVGGKKPDMLGYYYLPTLITNVKKGMPVYDEETFGPIAAIIQVKNEKEAIKIANDTCFGLGASLWTRDVKKAERLSKHIEAGNVFINDIVKSDARLPFGGIKKSGFGRELSSYGLKEFVNIQTVYLKNI